MEPHEHVLIKEKEHGADMISRTGDLLKMERRDYLEACESSLTRWPYFFKKEEPKETSSTFSNTGSTFFESNKKISCSSKKVDISSTGIKPNLYLWICWMRMRDFISLLLSYPVRLLRDDGNLVNDSWENDLICKGMQLRYVEGLVPNEILSDVKTGKRSIINNAVIPDAILNLALDLAVDHLFQTLFSKHGHAHCIKYIRLSTRSPIEKRAAIFRIKEALADKQDMLEKLNVFQGVLSIDASRYESQVENQVRLEVNQLLQLPMIQDNEILCTQNIEAAMSSRSYLVLLVDSDGDEMLDLRKVFSETTLSGVVVFITTESSTSDKENLIMEMDLEIRTEDHLLPWLVFCHYVGSEVVCSSSTIQTIAVRIVEECRGHLLAIAFVAKWLKNIQDFKLWELALHEMHSTNPSYDILKFHGSLSRIMINTFINFIWDGLSNTQKHCLVRCLFIPRIKDMMDDQALIDDWVSSLFMEAKEAENSMRELINHSVFLHVKAVGDNKHIWLPEETYEMLQSLHNLNPVLIKKVGLGLTQLTEPDNNEPWPSAVQIELAHNNLSDLPQSPNWPDLTVLVLQGNVDLTKIPPLFFVNVPLLRILDLSYTSVRELPTSFYHLEQLREFYLKGCECFTKLPPEIGRLQKLEKLDLEETQIIHLPIEFKELTNMQSLTLYFYEYCGKKKKPYSCSTIIPHGVISKLKGLRHLSIDVNPDDERWHENVQVILSEIMGLECLQTLSLYVPESKLLKFIPTHILQVDFRFIVGSYTQRIISGIPAAVDVKFKQSERSLKFIKGVDVPFEIKTLLKHGKALFLDRHMSIKNLTEFEMMNLEQLRVCILAECKEMQTIVDGRHSSGNSDMLPYLLFLSVSHMKKLRSIWEGPPSPCCIFGMLQSLTLQSCPRLMTLFSLEFLGNLSLLKELIIKDCPKLSTLISHEISELKLEFFLPKLSKLLLVHLPELTSISNGLYIGPSLKEIGFYGCPKLCSLSRKELSSQALTVIRGEIKWWKGLDWSKEAWGKRDPLPMFNSIFSPINEEADILTQLGIYNHDDVDDGPGAKYKKPQDSLQLLSVRDMTAFNIAPESIQKVRQVCQQQHIPYEKVFDVPKPAPIVLKTNHRICWTPQLHKTFVEAVDFLGGSKRATPRDIFNLMKEVKGLTDEGLTLYHVKSHLQKYRLMVFKPEKSERTPEKSIQQIISPDKDERMPMKLQELDEQLKAGRELQIQLEEQEKNLQRQREMMTDSKGKGIDSSTTLVEHDKFEDKRE